MVLLKYVNASVSTTAHAEAHATHPQTHPQFHLSIHLSIFLGGVKLRNKTTSFWFQLYAELVQLATQINNHWNLQCDFDIFALLLKYFCIISSYVWQPDFLEKIANGQMVKNGPKTWFLDFLRKWHHWFCLEFV